MRYIDDIELELKNDKYEVKQINFRSTFYSDFESIKEISKVVNNASVASLARLNKRDIEHGLGC